ncbi:hypothetical protein H0X06_05140 [Candidatus Dependentiae bacterium]|nr:hypothetical protein [Candidatus Dependentiae bacterium]
MKICNLKASSLLILGIVFIGIGIESAHDVDLQFLAEEHPLKNPTVTIFIHGTLPPKLLLKIPIIKKSVWYPKGLHPLVSLEDEFRLASVTRALCAEDPELFNKEFFYLFGWSGELSSKKRRKASKKLAHALLSLKAQYETKGISISLRLITHSHGGNVALHLAEFFTDTLPFTIDELILLACPVQRKTESYINHPLFCSILSLHSHLDIAQRIDPQGISNFLESVQFKGLKSTVSDIGNLGPLFSQAHFKPATHLRQVYVKYNSRALLHNDFISERYMRSLPAFMRSRQTLFHKKSYQEEITYIIP